MALVVISMAYSFWWDPLVHHTQAWVVPGDIWSTFRAAHWVGWGDLGGVYGNDTALVTFPGIAVVLAPVAMLSSHLRLSESLLPILINKPTSWLLLGPAMNLLGASCLFAIDAIAEELGADRRRRAVLCWMEAALFFEVLAIWGHPEDLLALGLSVYALLAGLRDRTTLSGWLWGRDCRAATGRPDVSARLGAHAERQADPLVCGGPAPFSGAGGYTPSPRSGALRQASSSPGQLRVPRPRDPWIALCLSPSEQHQCGCGSGSTARPFSLRQRSGSLPLGILSPPGPVDPGSAGSPLGLRCFFEAVMVPFYLGPLPSGLSYPRRRVAERLDETMDVTGSSPCSPLCLRFSALSVWGYWIRVDPAAVSAGLLLTFPQSERRSGHVPGRSDETSRKH